MRREKEILEESLGVFLRGQSDRLLTRAEVATSDGAEAFENRFLSESSRSSIAISTSALRPCRRRGYAQGKRGGGSGRNL